MSDPVELNSRQSASRIWPVTQIVLSLAIAVITLIYLLSSGHKTGADDSAGRAKNPEPVRVVGVNLIEIDTGSCA